MEDFWLLISCMHQNDHSILGRSNVQSNVVVVNQCDTDKIEKFIYTNKFGEEKKCIFISTPQRGLSRSRNMAISFAPDDAICLLCDDDEIFSDDIEAKVLGAYKKYSDADLIAFSLIRKDLKKIKIYPADDRKLKFRQILRTSSLQLTFPKKRIMDLNISFDEKMGSGTGNGGGEENKFLLNIKHKNGRLYYVAECIATVNPGESQWFKGYTPRHLQNIGWSSRRSMGDLMGFIYINYWVLTHRHFYGSDIKPLSAYKNILKGYFQKR